MQVELHPAAMLKTALQRSLQDLLVAVAVQS
jgi:hypothetical protein